MVLPTVFVCHRADTLEHCPATCDFQCYGISSTILFRRASVPAGFWRRAISQSRRRFQAGAAAGSWPQRALEANITPARTQRESPSFLEFPGAKYPRESVFEATARVSSNQPCCTPLHQELAGTSHPQTIDLCTNDSLEIGLVESQECISLSPESRKKDGPILGLGKHEHFVEGEFDGHQN
jgi:hypothetical protein